MADEKLDSDKLSPSGEKLSNFLRSRVFGQEDSVRGLAKAIDFWESGFSDPGRPIHVGFLVGPTTVGKSLLVESLAEYWFGDPKAVTHVDCNNLAEANLSPDVIYQPHLLAELRKNKAVKEKAEQHQALYGQLVELGNNLQLLHGELEKMELVSRQMKNNSADHQKLKELLKEKAEMEKELERTQKAFQMTQMKYAVASAEMKALYERLRAIIVFDHIDRCNEGFRQTIMNIIGSGKIMMRRTENNQVSTFEVPLSRCVIFVTCDRVMEGGDLKAMSGIKQIVGFRANEGMGTIREDGGASRQVYLTNVSAVKQYFPPEFIDCLRVYIFRDLSKEALENIFEKVKLAKIDPILKMKKIELELGSAVKDFIVKKVLEDEPARANPLFEKMRKYILRPIVRMLQSGQVCPGDHLIAKVEHDGNSGKDKVVYYCTKQ